MSGDTSVIRYKQIPRMHMMYTGTVTDGNGIKRTWTKSDFDGFASAYSFETEEKASPIVLGHPKDNAPRFGYIEEVWVEESPTVPGEYELLCKAQVVEQLYEAMEGGLYPNRSICVDLKEPVIYHLGVLGAVMPAFANLEPVAFSSGIPKTAAVYMDHATAWRISDLGSTLGRLREWIIGKFSLEDADNALPKWEIDWLIKTTADEEVAKSLYRIPGLNNQEITNNNNNGGGMSITPDELAALKSENETNKSENAALKTEVADLKSQVSAFSKKFEDLENAQVSANASAFAASLVAAKKILPFQQEVVMSQYTHAAQQAATLPLEYSVGGEKANENPLTKLQEQYSKLPILPVSAELTPNSVSPNSIGDITAKAHAYMAEQSKAGVHLEYHQAVSAVMKQ